MRFLLYYRKEFQTLAHVYYSVARKTPQLNSYNPSRFADVNRTALGCLDDGPADCFCIYTRSSKCAVDLCSSVA
jgi:hypothetical protein